MLQTRLTRLLGLRYPIIQGGMSWASSNAALALAVSRAGGLGTIAAGPMYPQDLRSEEHTSELQSLMRTSYAVFCLQKKPITSLYIVVLHITKDRTTTVPYI